MGLTRNSTGSNITTEELIIKRTSEDKVVALAGNPNVGKSTVFNELTGMNQHTGNWPGKTVTNAQGKYIHNNKNFILVDIPGTYSLMASSVEEEVARDFICFGNVDATVVITDATCLERNLNLVLQILEVTKNAVVCVNLLDEAKKKKISIDLNRLSEELKVPVVGTCATSKKGFEQLMDKIDMVSSNSKVTQKTVIQYDCEIEKAISILKPYVSDILQGKLDARFVSIKLLDLDDALEKSMIEFVGYDFIKNLTLKSKLDEALLLLKGAGIEKEFIRDRVVAKIVNRAEQIVCSCVSVESETYNCRDRKLDKILTSKRTGIPIMLILLGVIFWITLSGANYPSMLLSMLFSWLEEKLSLLFVMLNAPNWLHDLVVMGIFRTLAWVISVMLPPMAIFFPLFTLLEDSGYLPRIAFNMDKFFKNACAHGKQSLSMCMGFGCNACGVIGCRIIDSPRERLIAILTNVFVPCNGRFPSLIAYITMFFAVGSLGLFQSLWSTLLLTGIILLGIFITLFLSKILSKTILKGMPSSFALELPPYRRPQIGKVIVRSVLDRTIFVLGRAVAVAAPAGMIIWVLSNVSVRDISLLAYCCHFFNPFAKLMGLDGVILMAFILGFPANEIVLPIIIMGYMCTGNLTTLGNLSELHSLLAENGWTWVTALCTMLFSLMHFPCGTTLWTIRKETKSFKWTAAAFLLPTVTGMIICFIVSNLAKLLPF